MNFTTLGVRDIDRKKKEKEKEMEWEKESEVFYLHIIEKSFHSSGTELSMWETFKKVTIASHNNNYGDS